MKPIMTAEKPNPRDYRKFNPNWSDLHFSQNTDDSLNRSRDDSAFLFLVVVVILLVAILCFKCDVLYFLISICNLI